MSVAYTGIGWNRQKRLYDLVIVAGVLAFIAAFMAIGLLAFPAPDDFSPEILLIRALGSCAILMLHVVLWIGPLCRLSPRFLPLLYNRRHLGVCTFLVSAAHAALATVWYHGFGNINPIVALLSPAADITGLTTLPYEWLGLGAITILFVMAATSHDFWLRNLSPRVWKWLHMSVYGAYAMLVMHVALGVLQRETHAYPAALILAGLVITAGLHLASGFREVARDLRSPHRRRDDGGWIDVAALDDIREGHAAVVCLRDGERVAIFRHDNHLAAMSNVCEHQMGPLGEGRIVDGCVTCPWHGYQYLPGKGCSPPPFTETIATYEVRVLGQRVLLNPDPKPKGTPVPMTPATNTPTITPTNTPTSAADAP